MTFKPTPATNKSALAQTMGHQMPMASMALVSDQMPTAAKTALAKFNDKELQQIRSLKSQLVTTDKSQLFNYGADIQTSFGKISDEVLKFANCSDFDIVGDKLTQVIINVKSAQPTETSKLPLIGNWLTKLRNTKERIQGKFTTASAQVDRIVDEIDQVRTTIGGRLPVLEQMFVANAEMYKSLEMHIQAGKIAIEEITAQTDAFQAGLQSNPDPFDVQQIADARQHVTNIEMVVDLFERLAMDAVQNGPKIRLMQQNSVQIVDKFRLVKTHVVPKWKQQFAITLMIQEQKKAAIIDNELTNLSNDLAKESATMLKQTSVAIARNNQRGVLDLETLEFAQQELISSVEEVRRINEEGSKERKVVSARLAAMKQELKTQLTTRN